MEVIIKDTTNIISLKAPKNILEKIPYFESLLNFENDQEKIVLEVDNAIIVYNLIQKLCGGIPEWKSILEEARYMDFLGLMPSFPKDFVVPIEGFDLLLELASILGYSDDVVGIIIDNFPKDYSLNLLPRELIQRMIDQDHSFRIISSCNNTVKIWDYNKGTVIRTLDGHTGHIHCVAYSSFYQCIASGSFDRSIKIWNVITGKNIHTIYHDDWVRSVIYSPDNQYMASCSDDCTVRIFDAKTYILIHTLKRHVNWVKCIIFSPDSHRIVSGSTDNNIKIWDVETGVIIKEWVTRDKGIHTLAYSPDNQHIISGSDHIINIWDAKTYVLIHTLSKNIGHIRSLVYSSDNNFIVSGSIEEGIKIWDAKTYTLLNSLERNCSNAYNICFSSNMQYIISANIDQNIKIWDVKTGSLVNTIDLPDCNKHCVNVMDSNLIKKLKEYLTDAYIKYQ